tara:strand:+ start:2118 stop:2807 length:690 start_codon:yes stop_codon:yes gene_type:complete
MTNFNLMILAAGYGKRMKNLTKFKPKPLLKINNKELLRNNIDFFLSLGCKKIVINTHYLNEQIDNFIQNFYADKNIQLTYEPTLLNTGGGIKNALSLLEDKNFLVTNSDIFWNEENISDVKNLLKFINQSEDYCLLLSDYKKSTGIERSNGDFVIDNNYVRRWKKNDPIIFYSGLQILNPIIFDKVDSNKFSINLIWDELILKKKLKGKIMQSRLLHIGDIKTFNKIVT